MGGGGVEGGGDGGDDSVWIGTLDLGQVACPSLERRSLQLVSAVFVFKCLSWEYFFLRWSVASKGVLLKLVSEVLFLIFFLLYGRQRGRESETMRGKRVRLGRRDLSAG
jgi:hypothetical protein